MFGFLQGFAYGLFLSCLPWLIVGMINPRLVLPTDPPTRWQVALRYWLIFPFIAFILWVTSLWGGFSPSLWGWLAGLAAIPVAIPVERGWRRWQQAQAERRRQARLAAEAARERAELERKAREQGLTVLRPDQPPAETDDVILGFWQAKKDLLALNRPDLAIQADRLYSRYLHVDDLLRGKFDPRELTFERSRNMVAEVCRNSVDTLQAMASVARGIVGVDVAYVRQRLDKASSEITDEERRALERRLELVDDTERRLRELGARNEAIMTALDDTAVAVSAVATDRPQAAMATQQALKDLQQFADKAHRYGRADP